MLLYKDGDVLWKMPIRYWETQEPSRCVVVGDNIMEANETNHSLYVESDEYGHCVYVRPSDCWYNKDNAVLAAKLHKQLYDMRSHEEASVIVDRLLEDIISKSPK